MGGIVASYLAAQDAVKKGARFEAVVLIGPVNPNPGAAEAFSKRISVVEQGRLTPLFTNSCLFNTYFEKRRLGFDMK